jgi:uncharacterized LabA/DUF88 family protein
MARNYLLIDGENFVHKLVFHLKHQHLIKSRKDLTRVDLLPLLGDMKIDEINYYTTRIVMPSKKHKLFAKVERMRHWNSIFIPYLANQGVNFIKAGFLRARDGKKCKKCGYKNSYMAEKGVDVRLALDIVEKAERGVKIYVLSSDTDLLPAIELARKKKAEIIYVAFQDEEMRLLTKYASKTVVITDAQVKKAYKVANK